MERWYTLHTKPHKEYLVRDLMAQRGITAYLPLLQHEGRRAEPFFARYLFVRLDLAQVALSSLDWAPGVTRVVSFGGQPATVPDGVIQWLQDRLAHTNSREFYKRLPLRPNDRLRVVAGPLRGMEALFERRLSGEERARVLVEIMGRLTSCEIAMQWLERVG
ncbi:MAG TPA: transcription termination/antitermination NusG family protein [Anaerolineae bacterium]|nr:transcription termination/antitermination NusG family protein [Anaerolineae bacterium]HOQ99409.1 transcription termination/antitermination NusG family protein [Anaerolineae bacterium]HPL27813.1 transcription termination/antitermination NusG family protein [Anaerolineae bacterium]